MDPAVVDATPAGACLARADFGRLLEVLEARGYAVVGPTVQDGAIVYGPIRTVADLPEGWGDEQSPGRYRLRRRDDRAYFGFVVGPHSWKPYGFAPREALVRIRKKAEGFGAAPLEVDAPRLALLGVRACEIAALRVQDRVFLGSGVRDRNYAARRAGTLIIAVDCLEPAATCFCGAMEAGPEVREQFDLRLTELGDEFLVVAGTAVGEAIAAQLPLSPGRPDQQARRQQGLNHAASLVARGPDLATTPNLLLSNLEHPRWEQVGDRCLACGNCTQVCPTCFCFDIEDRSLLDGDEVVRERRWDSCFGADHSSVHGSPVQPRIADRYRQWLTHKLASWVTQFDSSGCTGCGRCITWCPVGIDLREEVEAIAQSPGPAQALPEPLLTRSFAEDVLVPAPAQVVARRHEHGDVYTLVLRVDDAGYAPGQFNMLSVPGVGDVPISVAGHEDGHLLHTIREVGAVTRALVAARAGDVIGVRGPFGSAWPLAEAKGRPVTLIAGGIGLAPLRGALLALLEAPEDYPQVRLLYGARTPDEILYDRELIDLNRRFSHFKASVTVDRATPGWTGHVGVVTRLMRRKDLPTAGMYWVCGPEVMMRFALAELQAAGVPSRHAYLSIERNMKCAVGLCGRCQYGPFFACKDGPVFRYDQIAHFFATPGF